MTSIDEVQYGSPRYRDAVELRRAVLRFPLGLDFGSEELARETAHRHLVAIRNGSVIGCLMIVDEPDAGRIRQMAVRDDCRGLGVGRELMAAAERLVGTAGKSYVVLHARENAVGFYEKLGYAKEGKRFIEVGIGHWRMTKQLTPRHP